jgi:integrase/recombinase XerD
MTTRPSPPAPSTKPSVPVSGLTELARLLARVAAAEALSLACTVIGDQGRRKTLSKRRRRAAKQGGGGMTRGIKPGAEGHRLCLPVAQWPESDRALWEQSLIGGDPFDSGARADLRPATQRAVSKGYGRWLHYLSSDNTPHADQPPAARITLPRVRRYVEALQQSGNKNSTIAARLEELRAAALVMDPAQSWDWLKRPAARLRSRSRAFPDSDQGNVPSSDLLNLGFDLMQNADQESRPGHRAVTYRDGLLIAFLALQPLRLRNVASLELGRTLVKAGESWLITIPATETKTHVPIEVPWPDVLLESLEHYLAEVRPILSRRRRRSPIPAGSQLWISAEGRPLSMKRLSAAIALRTKSALGIRLTPHRFRDAAATTLAIEDPLHVRAAAPLLGHASLSTTECYYQRATSLRAQRAYAEAVTQIRHRRTI